MTSNTGGDFMNKLSAPIGIIGAMEDEVKGLVARLENPSVEEISGIKFYTGTIFGKSVVIAKCGVGKVFAAICTTAMILRYAPSVVINTGVAGGLSTSLRCADTVIATALAQHDMDTSALGDPVGLISGIDKIYFDTDKRACELLALSADELGIRHSEGLIVTGDKFVAGGEERDRILSIFPALACEMEGGAVAHAAYVHGVPFAVIRAISDGADSESTLDYPAFLKIAVKNSEALTLSLIEKY